MRGAATQQQPGRGGASSTRKGGGGAVLWWCSSAAALLVLAGQAKAFLTPAGSLPSRRATTLAGAGQPWRRRTGVVRAAARGNEEWETNGGGSGDRENSWGTQQQQQQAAEDSNDDWYMNTARIHYLREMEKLGQELHEVTGMGEGGAADLQGLLVSTPEAPAQPVPHAPSTEHEKAMREVANLEELRRQEVLVAESCATNWREEPVFSRPVGFVPGNRKVQQVKLSENRVMYGSDGGVVGLASALDGRELFRTQAHSALVTALDYDATSGWMLSAADDGMVKVYREVGACGHGGRDASVRVEEMGVGMRHHSNRVVAAEILDHRWGLTASMDGKMVIFELEGGALVQEIWASDTLLAASVCRGYLFAGLMGGAIEAFSIRNGGRSAFRYLAQKTPVRSMCTYPLAGNNIRVVVGGQDGALRQFQVRPVMSTEGVWKMPTDRSFDDRLVLLCNTHVDHETREVDQGFVLKGHKGPVVAVACDEEKVVSASEDGSIIVWDAAKSAPCYAIRRHVDGDLVGAVDFNERYLVNDGTPGKVQVWDYAVSPPPRSAKGALGGAKARRPSSSPSSSPRGGSRGSGGGQHRRARRKDGPSPSGPQGSPPPSPDAEGAPNFPFVGGWNLGHGPTDLNGVGGLPGQPHQQSAASSEELHDHSSTEDDPSATSSESDDKGLEGDGST